MDRHCQVWEQEIYSEMVYRSSQPCFHSFEAEREVAGICFADEREAADFLNAVRSVGWEMEVTPLTTRNESLGRPPRQCSCRFRLSKLQNREKRRSMRPEVSAPRMLQPSQQQQQQKQQQARMAPIHEVSLAKPDSSPATGRNRDLIKFGHGHRGKDNQQRRKIRKAEIGAPTAFVHVSGIKASSDGFETVDNLDEVDPRIREFLKVAGLSDNILSDSKAKREIYQVWVKIYRQFKRDSVQYQ